LRRERTRMKTPFRELADKYDISVFTAHRNPSLSWLPL
jgi:hypothetical protein